MVYGRTNFRTCTICMQILEATFHKKKKKKIEAIQIWEFQDHIELYAKLGFSTNNFFNELGLF